MTDNQNNETSRAKLLFNGAQASKTLDESRMLFVLQHAWARWEHNNGRPAPELVRIDTAIAKTPEGKALIDLHSELAKADNLPLTALVSIADEECEAFEEFILSKSFTLVRFTRVENALRARNPSTGEVEQQVFVLYARTPYQAEVDADLAESMATTTGVFLRPASDEDLYRFSRAARYTFKTHPILMSVDKTTGISRDTWHGTKILVDNHIVTAVASLEGFTDDGDWLGLLAFDYVSELPEPVGPRRDSFGRAV